MIYETQIPHRYCCRYCGRVYSRVSGDSFFPLFYFDGACFLCNTRFLKVLMKYKFNIIAKGVEYELFGEAN